MKESFSELYQRLYKENFEELEALRAKAKKNSVAIIFITATLFILATINPIFIIIGIVGLVIWISKASMSNKYKGQSQGKSYQEVFKEKIVGPMIENVFDEAKYDSGMGLSRGEYLRAEYNEHFDRFRSEDLIKASLKLEGEEKTFITFSEVHTQRRHEDEDGNVDYVTVFNGLAGNFSLNKNLGKAIYIRSNGRVSNWNKNKIKMDMSEFEKIFDVESDDKILAMRILTSDVMTEMIDLYQKYKYRFEISIIEDTVHMRLRTGTVFEPKIFGSSMELQQLEKYYLILKALMSIATHVHDTISKLDI